MTMKQLTIPNTTKSGGLRTRLDFGVSFDELHTADDFGLLFVRREISAPEPQTSLIEIPGRNGVIDMSESLTGRVQYKTREISITFRTFTPYEDWQRLTTRIANALHGKRMQIVFDDDAMFYYSGRVSVSGFTQIGRDVGEMIISATDVQPYKYDRTTSDEGWLWDPFSFEYGVIPGPASITAPGDIVFVPEEYTDQFIIKVAGSSLAVVMTINGDNTKTYPCISGNNVFYDLPLVPGVENTLSFTGNGTVTLSYRGGRL